MPAQIHPTGLTRRATIAPNARWMLVVVLVLSSVGAALASPRSAAATYLGRGEYSVTASVFGTTSDDLIGEMTSSGRLVAEYDRIVALPACTVSSCPWLSIGADPDGDWGPQTACAEYDGYCWVEVTSDETGLCAVAPVVELGPLFVRDNWWATKPNRTYPVARGIPAAERARDGADFGFGPGMSDAGYDIQNVYRYAAGVDLGAGTFVDLGLDPDQGTAPVTLRLLWQSPGDATSACAGTAGNGVAAEDVNLRSGPSTDDDVLAVLNPGTRVSISGALQNGFYQVDAGGMRGWAHSDFVRPDGGKTGNTVGMLLDSANLRAKPTSSGEVVTIVPEGSMTVVTGPMDNGFIPVRFNGKEGWIANILLDLGDAAAGGDNGGGTAATAITTDDVNLRTGPGRDFDVLTVVPNGTQVSLTGDEENGFAEVEYDGQSGWISMAYLVVSDGEGDGGGGAETVMTVTEDLNLRAGPSTADAVLLVMPAGAEVTVTGSQQNGFLPVTYKGKNGWAFADFLA